MNMSMTGACLLPALIVMSAAAGAGDRLQDGSVARGTDAPTSQPASTDGRAALLMIEFVNEWLAPDGKLRPLMQDASQLERSQMHARQALQAARVAGMPVIHASLPLSDDYRELGQARFGLRGAIRNAGTWKRADSGWQFFPPFTPEPQEFVVSGRVGASAFAASDLDNYLRGQGITRLYLAGYATHVCIESTMRAAHDLGYEPIVLSDATAAFTAAQQRHVLDEVVHHFGAAMPTRQFVEGLRSGVAPDPAHAAQAAHAADSAASDDAAATAGVTSQVHRSGAAMSMRTVTAPGQQIPGISGAAVLDGGRLVLLSGHVPVAADGVIPTSLPGQLEQTFRNLDATLREAGGDHRNLARLTFYVRDYRPDMLPVIREARDRWLSGHAPSSALIGVAALFHPDVMVEIDGVAVL